MALSLPSLPTPMPKRFLLTLAVTSLFALSCSAEGGDTGDRMGPLDGATLPPADLDRISVGDNAPDFRLAALQGEPVRLSDLRGSQDVVLVFYRGHW